MSHLQAELAISVEHLTVSYGSRPALLDVNLQIEQGLLVGVIGPNGSGKSTLIKALLGFVPKDFGSVHILGRPTEQARGMVAYVPQRGAVDWDFPIRVEDVVMMGRYGQIPWYRDPGPDDLKRVHECLKLVKMFDLKDRQIGQLSGGQQQRVFMARALAQGGEVLLLDEPFAGVDAATERSILEVLTLARQEGRTLVVVHHDLNTAGEYFDRLVLLKQRLIAYGPPQRVLREELLGEVYEGRLRLFGGLHPGKGREVQRL